MGFVIVFLEIFGIGIISCYHYEKKLWNRGFNPKNGMKWQHFDNDSQGGRGYTDSVGTYIWISYPVDRKTLAGLNIY